MTSRISSIGLGITVALLLFTGCQAEGTKVPDTLDVGPPPQVEAPAPVLLRLTQQQYTHCVADLFGPSVVVPSGLEPDSQNDGLVALGSSYSSVSPLGAERYADAAFSIAKQAVEQAGIGPDCSLETEGCLREFAQSMGGRVWRRPLVAEELDVLVSLGQQAQSALVDSKSSLETVLATLLQSPYFLYRVEVGGGAEGASHLTDFELASRLSFFLWNTMPDDELLAAAIGGQLAGPDELAAQVDRMLSDPRARQGVRNFFAEWLDLYRLDELTKDPNVFKHFAPELGSMAREETLLVAEDLVFEKNADMREFLTTRTTFASRRLAAIYNAPSSVLEGFGPIEFPLDSSRRGFLGHVSFLALNAHAVSSSPTLRGLFVRERLLCHTIPAPPANVNTAIPAVSTTAKSLKERLQVHMEDPSCSPCHLAMDPIGFGLENFDGVGRFRLLDNGVPIDASGNIDGEPFANAAELAEDIAEHPDYARCLVRKLYTYASGRHLGDGEGAMVDWLVASFEAKGRRFLGLMRDMALSKQFRSRGEVAP